MGRGEQDDPSESAASKDAASPRNWQVSVAMLCAGNSFTETVSNPKPDNSSFTPK